MADAQDQRGGARALVGTWAFLLVLARPTAAWADAPAGQAPSPEVHAAASAPAGAPPRARAASRLADRRAWETRLVEERRRNAALLQRVVAQEDRLEGLELLVATAPPDAPLPRRWGHALLRFVVRGGDPLDDVVLGLVAVPDSPRISYWAGLTGGYPLAPELGTMTWALQTFVRDQDRPLARWALPSTAAQRHALLRDLAARSGVPQVEATEARSFGGGGGAGAPRQGAPARGPGTFGAYTFAGNNCARGLVDRLEDAGIVAEDDSFGTHVPARLGAVLEPMEGPLRELPSIPGLGGVYARAGAQLGITTREVRRGAWPDDTGALAGLAVTDRLALLWTVEMAPPAARANLLATLPPPDARPSLAEVFGVTTR